MDLHFFPVALVFRYSRFWEKRKRVSLSWSCSCLCSGLRWAVGSVLLPRSITAQGWPSPLGDNVLGLLLCPQAISTPSCPLWVWAVVTPCVETLKTGKSLQGRGNGLLDTWACLQMGGLADGPADLCWHQGQNSSTCSGSQQHRDSHRTWRTWHL